MDLGGEDRDTLAADEEGVFIECHYVLEKGSGVEDVGWTGATRKNILGMSASRKGCKEEV